MSDAVDSGIKKKKKGGDSLSAGGQQLFRGAACRDCRTSHNCRFRGLLVSEDQRCPEAWCMTAMDPAGGLLSIASTVIVPVLFSFYYAV